jgi:4-hydroxybenzoate polyprenyltransferase
VKGRSRRKNLTHGALGLLRPHHWIKNLLVFVPLLTSHEFFNSQKIFDCFQAFCAFCLVASAGYIVNDLRDVSADRGHFRKKNRSIAAGRVSPVIARVLAVLLGIVSLVVSYALGTSIFWACLGYLVLSLAYTFVLKRLVLADIFVLSLFYVLRVFTGDLAAKVQVSPWLLEFSFFVFVGLACVKRYVEFSNQGASTGTAIETRGYGTPDVSWLAICGVASMFTALVIFSLYLKSSNVVELYHQPEWLEFLIPVLSFWLLRFWVLAFRRKMHDDPVLFALTDPVTYGVVLLSGVVIFAASR